MKETIEIEHIKNLSRLNQIQTIKSNWNLESKKESIKYTANISNLEHSTQRIATISLLHLMIYGPLLQSCAETIYSIGELSSIIITEISSTSTIKALSAL